MICVLKTEERFFHPTPFSSRPIIRHPNFSLGDTGARRCTSEHRGYIVTEGDVFPRGLVAWPGGQDAIVGRNALSSPCGGPGIGSPGEPSLALMRHPATI